MWSIFDIVFRCHNTDHTKNNSENKYILPRRQNKIHPYHLQDLYIIKIKQIMDARSNRFKYYMGGIMVSGITSGIISSSIIPVGIGLTLFILIATLPNVTNICTNELWDLIEKQKNISDIIQDKFINQYDELKELEQTQPIRLSIDFFGHLHINPIFTLRETKTF